MSTSAEISTTPETSTAAETSPARELRVGVVGVGQRAVLAEYANRPGYSRVVSCADPTERGRADARRLFGPEARIHDDYRAMTGDDLDAVFVFTPDYLHTEPVLRFLEAGIAVFVEKPMAISIEDCDAMLAAAKAKGVRLYVGHNLRHLPALRTMRRLIDEGAVGRVRAVWCRHFVGHGGDYYFKDWHAEREKTTSLLLQKGAHDIDVIHWLAGGYSREVVGLGALTVYGDNPHRRGAGEPPAAERMPEWFDRTAWPPARLRSRTTWTPSQRAGARRSLSPGRSCRPRPRRWTRMSPPSPRRSRVIGRPACTASSCSSARSGCPVEQYRSTSWGFTTAGLMLLRSASSNSMMASPGAPWLTANIPFSIGPACRSIWSSLSVSLIWLTRSVSWSSCC